MNIENDVSRVVPDTPSIARVYRSKGISDFFPWQRELLELDGVLDSRNVVYSAPTSGGKSLPAELLVARTVIVR